MELSLRRVLVIYSSWWKTSSLDSSCEIYSTSLANSVDNLTLHIYLLLPLAKMHVCYFTSLLSYLQSYTLSPAIKAQHSTTFIFAFTYIISIYMSSNYYLSYLYYINICAEYIFNPLLFKSPNTNTSDSIHY